MGTPAIAKTDLIQVAFKVQIKVRLELPCLPSY